MNSQYSHDENNDDDNYNNFNDNDKQQLIRV